MFSKNNLHELIRKQEPKKQRFTIKKLTVGVASVLIGFTFMGVSASANDNATQPAGDQTQQVAANTNNGSATSVNVNSGSTVKLDQSDVAASQDNQAEQQSASAAQQNSQSATQTSAQPANDRKGEETNTLTLSGQSATPAVNANTFTENKAEEQPTKAFDLQSFTGALANKNVHEITLTKDIDFGDGTSQTNLTTRNQLGRLQKGELAFNDGKLIENNNKYSSIAHTVVIDGQNKYSLNMGDTFISIWKNNYNNTNEGWNITFKNLKINQTNSTYSPIYFSNASEESQKKSSLTFENVTANVGRSLNAYSGQYVPIHFIGDNTITVANMPKGANAVNGGTIDFTKSTDTNSTNTTTFTINGDIKGSGNSGNWANAAIYASSTGKKAVNIADGTTVNVNSKSADFRGITAGHIGITGDQGAELYVAGNLNEDLANGHGTAIWVGNLTIDGGKVNIHTMQDNQADGKEDGWVNGVTNYNGYHFAPISLGVGSKGAMQDSDAALTINNSGELHVTRGNVTTLAPLISYGTGGAHNNSKFGLTVGQDGTDVVLDLQDGASTPSTFHGYPWDKTGAYLGAKNSIFWPGMIHMFGAGCTANLNFGDVKYVNLQRTGSQRGFLIALEGKNNQASINASGIPLAQWMQNNTTAKPDHAWLIDGLTSQNEMGNYDANFVPASSQPSISPQKKDLNKLFGQSNGQVTMAPIMAGENSARYNNGNVYGPESAQQGIEGQRSNYLQNLMDNFNWWTPRRISFGHQLDNNPDIIKTADAYQPKVQTINTTTKKTLKDLKVKDGIEGFYDKSLNVIPANKFDKVDWANSQFGVDWAKTPWANASWMTKPGTKLTEDEINAAVDKVVNSDADQQNFDRMNLKNEINAYNTFVDNVMKAKTSDNGNLAKADAYTSDGKLNNAESATIVYTDGSADFVNIPINVTDQLDSEIYQPAYDPMNVEQGKSDSEDPSYKESTTKNTDGETITINPGSKAPKGTKYEIPSTADVPFATVDPSTGTLTIAPTADNSKTGLTTVPVKVTYPDDSTDTVKVPVYIGDATHTGKITTDPNDPSKVTGAYEVVTKAPADLKAHETTDNSMDLKPGDAVQAINHYTIGEDGKITKASVDPKNATIAWKGEAPSTVVPTATASEDIDGTVSVTVDGTTVDSNKMTIPAAGATGKDVDTPIKVTAGQKLTPEQAKELVDTANLDKAGIKYTATWATAPKAGDKQGTIKLTFTDKDANGQPTYLNVKTKDGAINVVPEGEYDPSYKPVSVKPGTTTTDEIQTPNKVPAPDGTTFTKGTGDNVPDWATVDPSTGTITLNPGKDVKPGHYTVPVTVTVPGEKPQTIEAPVTVTGMNHDENTSYTDQSATSFSSDVQSYHKTSYDYTPDAVKSGFDTITVKTGWNGKDYTSTEVYKLNADGTKFVSDKGHSFDASAIHYTWINDLSGVSEPNTNVSNFDNGSADTLYKNADGSINTEEQTGPNESLYGNSKWRYNFTVDKDVVPELSLGFNTYASWSNVYFNFYGATAKDDLTAKTGDDVPTDASSLEDYLNMGQLPTGNFDNGKLTGATWATQPGKDGKFVKGANKGTVRLEFNNDPKNYLDVPVTITANGEVAPTEESFTQNIIYKDANGKEIKTVENAIKGTFTSEKPATVSAEAEKTAIDNNVPENWKIASSYKYPAAETVSTKTPAAIEVLVEHGTKDITPTDPGVNPTDPKYKDMFTTVTRDIYQTKPGDTEKKIATQSVSFGRDGVEDLVTGEVTAKPDAKWEVGKIEDHKFVAGGQAEFPAYTKDFQIKGYDSYVDGTKTTEVKSASALKDGQPVNGDAVHITYLKSGEQVTPVPYDPSNKDMNKDVTRTITIYQTDGSTQTIPQNVHFVRGGKGQNGATKDSDGNITWTPWTVATKDGDSWKSTGTSEGTWAEYNVPAVDGYKSTVDGKEATKVNAETVNADTPNANVTVAYTKTTQPTDPSINPNQPGDKYKDMFAHPTRTIKVANPLTGKTTTEEIQTVWFGRTMTVSTDKNVKPVYGEWQLGKVENDKFVATPGGTAEWAEFSAPQFDGYTASQAKVAEETVTANTKDTTVTITYKNSKTPDVPVTPTEDTTVTYTFHDDTDNKNVGTPVVVSGQPGTTQATGLTIPTGYKLAKGQNLPTTVTMPASDENITIHLVHGTTTIKPTDPGVTPTDPAYKDMFRDVTRTIIVANPLTGESEVHKQTVQFSRSKTVDSVTNAVISYGAWTPTEGAWAEFDAPQFDGYAASQAKVAEETVTANTKDTTVTITYHKTNTPTDADKNTPEPQPIDTPKGVVPDPADGIKNKGDLPDGTKYTWEDPDKVKNDVNTPGTHDEKIVVTYPDGSTDVITVTVNVINPDNGGNQSNGTNVTTGNNGNGNGGLNTSTTTVANNDHGNKQVLPQTGNTKNNSAAIAGLGLASLTALLGLGGLKKKND